MFVKLSFIEETQSECFDLRLFYMLTAKPAIIETLPAGVKENTQTRIPIKPALKDVYGLYNACRYDYYFNCGDADRQTISKVLDVLLSACGEELPSVEADNQYLFKNKNLIVHTLNFALETAKKDKNIDNQALKELVIQEFVKEGKKHEEETRKQSSGLFKSKDSTQDVERKKHRESTKKMAR